MSSFWKSLGLFAAGFASCLLLIVGGFAFFYFIAVKPNMDRARRMAAERALPFPQQPRPADFDAQWAGSDGTRLDFATMRGKVVVLNVWATWCQPCLAELPGLTKLAARYATADDVRVICVTEEPASQVGKKIKSQETLAITYSTEGVRLPALYRTAAIPATFVINKRGEVVFQHIGAANWASEGAVRYIESLRGEELNKSPKATPGQRPPASPRPSSGAPQL